MGIIGHKKQREYLKKLKEQDEIPHAMLFCGPEHLGKREVAIEFLKSFFGENLFSHPDFIYIEPLENEIQISQVRDLNWKLSLKPFSAPFKAVIVNEAHLMNQEAQNCFLKTLEEPRGRTVLILVSEYPDLLLPTIKSRVQKLKFYPVDRKEMEVCLKEKRVGEREARMLLEISMGKPGLAVDFIVNPQLLADFKKRVKEITVLIESDLTKRFNYAKELSEGEESREVLNVWLNYFRNILLSKMNLQKKWVVLHKDFSLEKLKTIIKNIQSTLFLASTTNASKKLALEVLLMEM